MINSATRVCGIADLELPNMYTFRLEAVRNLP